jgi:DNA modification methylase
MLPARHEAPLEVDMEPAIFGTDLFGEQIIQKKSGPLAERFKFAPFSVLDGRSGEWQERKAAWLSMGIKSEESREDVPLWRKASSADDAIGVAMEKAGGLVSVFDPVLCEMAYRWFSPPEGLVVDPFAGGSVRGVVAAMVNRRYWGCDLRHQQIAANYAQAEELLPEEGIERVDWVCGDSLETLDHSPESDFIFSCPPYGDLEVYSDDPKDLSNMEWHTFLPAYKRIVFKAVKRLKPNRFACFVVGDFRDSKGFYRNFVSETIDAFQNGGAMLYNEAILLTAVGTAAMRAGGMFQPSRKLCKVHQNVLVFCKGDWKAAAAACRGSGNEI